VLVHPELQIRARTQNQIENRVWAKVWEQVRDQTWDQLWDLRAHAWDQLEEDVNEMGTRDTRPSI